FDWLDTLVSMGLLQRKGLLEEAVYSNTGESALFLDKKSPQYVGGMLEMADDRLYGHWSRLEQGLRSGEQQNEGMGKPQGNMEFFGELYKDPYKLRSFIDAMRGIQTGNFIALAEKFDFSQYDQFLDLGGADGWLSIQICLRHTAIRCTTFDLPPVLPLAQERIAQFQLSDRIRALAGDFSKDEFPAAQVIAMGNILHGMNEAAKLQLMKRVYAALPAGGAFIAIENIIDDDRRQNTFGLLMSLNMLIENGEAFDYTMKDFSKWAKEAGFGRIESIPLAGPASAAVAYK
ncbi:MAG: methyltransferase, partial [Bacteroidetes bacterium]|nr:methyltransferase [Bacteroidota bacterium]